MEKLVIREATSQDVPKLGQLNHLLIQDEGHENPMDIPALRQRMAMWLKHEYICYVCLKDEQIAGYALYKSIPRGFYLRQLFVLERFRRLGIATKLLDELFETVWKGKEVRGKECHKQIINK